MRTAETKTASQTLQTKKGEQTFFDKERNSGFFSKNAAISTPFFSPSTIQAKLTIGQPGDKYEQEADAMADQVVQKMSTRSVQRKCAECAAEEKEGTLAPKVQPKAIFEINEEQPIQKKCAACQEDSIQPKPIQMQGGPSTASPDLENRLSAMNGSGSPLPKDTRSSMESAFGADFSNVRVHTGQSAVQMNQELGAQAFTHGSDVYFNSGKYDTNSSGGQRLLAHELTHVVQQNGDQIRTKMGDGHDLAAPRFSGNPRLEAAYDNERLIRWGTTDRSVAILQKALMDLGIPMPKFGSDGIFGAETYKAVKQYQQRKKIGIDGIVGKETMTELDKDFSSPAPKPKPKTISGDSAKLKAFKAGLFYFKNNYQPSTQRGLFDIFINPNKYINAGVMTISVKVNYKFTDGDPAKFKGLKGQKKEWSKKEKAKWKKDVKSKVKAAWGGNFEFVHPDYHFALDPKDIPAPDELTKGMSPVIYPYKMKVAINISEVDKDYHYQFRAKKIPRGKFAQSAVTSYKGNKLNKNFYDMDSEDLTPTSKGAPGGGKQRGVLHEFGHIFGLGDEYNKGKKIAHAGLVKSMLGENLKGGKSDNIMASGEKFEKRSYVTFLEALRKTTKDEAWKYE